MFPLSTRVKEAIKIGLAMVIAYWVAMQLRCNGVGPR
jgi:hypothetical protein